MIRRILLLILLLIGGGAAMATMKWPDLLGRPEPKPDQRVDYGGDPLQHVDVWLPKGKGPFPTIVMIHGGCWQTDIAKADIMNWIAADLRARGIAVWNIEYRGVDRPGGGFPGTFSDVGAAIDTLKSAAPVFHLDIKRVVAIGHSAGGHLVLWAAARDQVSSSAPFFARRPLPIAAVVSLGGLPDLEAARSIPADICGGAPVIDKLVGQPSEARPDVYADTSPARLPPPAATITLINGELDRIAPPAFASAYAAKMQAGGKAIEKITIPVAGHVELIAPDTTAWKATIAVIERMLKHPQ
jgi:acetyl esterase/lipase